MIPFTHLHVHTQFSVLDGASEIDALIQKAKDDGMKALAITDHGSMFGVKQFHISAKKAGIKPILGCEMYLAAKGREDRSDKDDRGGNHLILLAKNKTGYHNLTRLVSIGYTEGFYYKPRIDMEVLSQYAEGLIATSACLGGIVPPLILAGHIDEAEKTILRFKELFGGDFYLELQRHPSGDPKMDEDVYERQQVVNAELIKLSEKTGVKLVVANDVHFINAEDAEAHDRLICLNTGKDLHDPDRMRYTKQEYLKTQEEMNELFADQPQALETTSEIADKIEEYELDHEPIMPDFPLPEGFDDADEYLRHLTYKGADELYPEITEEIRQRIDFELETIKNMGFPGYFLIVQDFIRAAKEMDVSVGPGRGSAAGSVVAYCNGITNVDPIKYKLLFERFLNPDRISMPDIDIDFDEDGRDRVMKWVVDKYGKDKVAQIITFGKMAPKMAIRDVARIQKLPLPEADRLAKMVPEDPGTKFKDAYKKSHELLKEREHGPEEVREVLKYAETLEGSVRNVGTHACGVIIGRDPLTEHIPVCLNRDGGAIELVTQYDGNYVESVGMLKMDFLGLKTLSIIKDAVENVKLSKGKEIDIDNISHEDKETLELYGRGETVGVFQFESDGMRKYLQELKPDRFEDIIAMNALYRPGPIEYIPDFINRKFGREKVSYDLPIMEEYLKETYGITVYQEQVMLLSRAMAGFSRGDSDKLRKAMGKKITALMAELKLQFEEGCKNNGIDKKISDKVWADWEKFASYAFNKSHSTCYAYVSFRMAYLKAHYPAEFMAAVLSRNLSEIKKITKFMEECNRMKISVLGPDVNESFARFMVNKDGDVRFGLSAIKGVGGNAVDNIINEREANGPYKDLWDFIERIDLSAVNKKSLEALAVSGALDNLSDIKRHEYVETTENGISFLDSLVRYGNLLKQDKNTSQQSLFGDSEEIDVMRPEVPQAREWTNLERLNNEKELIGIYLSAHPLDDYKLEVKHFCTTPLDKLNKLEELNGQEVHIGGVVTKVEHRTTKSGKPFGSMTIEDYSTSYQIMFFTNRDDDYIRFRQYMQQGYALYIHGKVQERWQYDKAKAKEYELKVKSIELLNNLIEKKAQGVQLRMSTEQINDEMINKLLAHLDKHKGNKKLQLYVQSKEDKMELKMFSRNQKVNLSNEFLDYFEREGLAKYKLIRV